MDGCPNQNSKFARDAIDQVGDIIIKITARSPDLNSIETTFNQVSELLKLQAVERNIAKESFQEFSQRIKGTPLDFDRSKIDKVILSMPKRVQEIMDAGGQRIDY